MNSLLERFDTLDRLLNGDHAFISVDTSFEGVTLPEHLQSQASVVLQLSRLFVGGMSLDKEKVTANLKFAGRYHECIVPLAAIWGMHSPDGEEQYYWPEEMSVLLMKSLVMQMFGGKRPQASTHLNTSASPVPVLAEVPALERAPEGEAEESASGADQKAKESTAGGKGSAKPGKIGKTEKTGKRGKKSHLSVVK